jgi:hypothetical protein
MKLTSTYEKILNVLNLTKGLPLSMKYIAKFTGIKRQERLIAYIHNLHKRGLINRAKYRFDYNNGKKKVLFCYWITPLGISFIRKQKRMPLLNEIMEVAKYE